MTTPASRTGPLRKMAAVGIGVSDIVRSEDFYTRVLGMKVQQRIELAHLREVIVGYEGATPIALMHWLDGSAPGYRNNPVKLAFYVSDAAELVDRVRADGLPVAREAVPMPEFHNMIIALVEDPDGYVVEFIQSAQGG